mmetsp:Transcript_150298/g.280323  ORF Transcript_150298/g.280323 Transcript_150298/m.280323 type:complete len:208 (-) Transcript_150298:186-809(-)
MRPLPEQSIASTISLSSQGLRSKPTSLEPSASSSLERKPSPSESRAMNLPQTSSSIWPGLAWLSGNSHAINCKTARFSLLCARYFANSTKSDVLRISVSWQYIASGRLMSLARDRLLDRSGLDTLADKQHCPPRAGRPCRLSQGCASASPALGRRRGSFRKSSKQRSRASFEISSPSSPSFGHSTTSGETIFALTTSSLSTPGSKNG